MSGVSTECLHDVLAIAAHPDDVEFTCGGTLISLADKGKKTAILDLTAGERGTLGDPVTRLKEADAAAKLMRITTRRCAHLPDTEIANTTEQRLIVAQHVRDMRPDTVILPHWVQRHPDHLATCEMGADACFFAGMKNIDLKGEPFRPNRIIYVSYFNNHDHSFVVDITATFERKLAAIACYASQFAGTTPLSDSLDALKHIKPDLKPDPNFIFQPGVSVYEQTLMIARLTGISANVAVAEGYSVKRGIVLEDFSNVAVGR